MLTVHPESHLDHVPRDVLTYILGRFHDRTAFFKETFELPLFFGDAPLSCGLYGPVMGDPIITPQEVFFTDRPGRKYVSRMIVQPQRPTRLCSVIAGPYKGEPCVLFTVFGGSLAPRELYDPTLPEAERAASEEFWSQHALATIGG